MKLLIFSVALMVALCANTCEARPSESSHERFDLKIVEHGTEFRQEVDLEEKEGIVMVHVPPHNNVDETYFITDTNKHLTMRVAPQQKMCFLTENDPEELPSAEVWRKTRDIVQSEIIKDADTKKKMMSYEVTRSLDSQERADLPPKMKQMCDGLPTVKIEPISKRLFEPEQLELMPKLTPFINYTSPSEEQSKRYKRQLPFETYIDECSPRRTRQKCVVFHNDCYFIIDCSSAEDTQGREAAMCTQKDHIYDDVRCCIPCCLDKVSDENPSPYCYDDRLTKEMICPHYDFAAEAAGDDPSVLQTTPRSLSKLNGNHGHGK